MFFRHFDLDNEIFMESYCARGVDERIFILAVNCGFSAKLHVFFVFPVTFPVECLSFDVDKQKIQYIQK